MNILMAESQNRFQNQNDAKIYPCIFKISDPFDMFCIFVNN